MNANQLAVFPLSLVESAIESFGKGIDHNLSDRFGYVKAKKMSPAVMFVKKDLSFIHCGSLPLVAWVGYSYSNRFNVGRGCYINTSGEHVYPG